ncbi:MAG TPA: hypothetical protein VFW28_18020 [Micropepsaceae bacterium]|nr:hypothetical protein [Micropepsaceae bacterium]
MSGNFASLTADLLVRKGEAAPSPIMRPQNFRFAEPPATHKSERRESAAPLAAIDVSAKPRRMVVNLSAREHEMLALVAVRKGTTPQHLLRKALHELLARCITAH